MNALEVKFLGMPSIKLNGDEIHLSFAKAEYVVYLLAYEKSMRRDKLCVMLWGDTKEDVAKKSLRNAVYIVRKNLYDEIIVSPKRSLLQLDENCEIITDIDKISGFIIYDNLNEIVVNNFLDIYKGDFLEGIENKNAEFENWLAVLRGKYRKLYIDKLKEIITVLIDKKTYALGESCCKRLIELEEFDEMGYRNLMFIYTSQERYAEAANVYNKLENALRESLSVKPLPETRKMFDIIMKKQIFVKVNINKADFYGREKEIELLNNNFINFISSKDFRSYLIYGEAGIGKTTLIEAVTQNLDSELIKIRTTCYEAESGFMFKLWDKIFERLSDILREKNINIPCDILSNINKLFPTLNIGVCNGEGGYAYSEMRAGNNSYIENLISPLFSFIGKKQKVVFVIDDLNWADKSSLELLNKIIFLNRYNLMILATCRNEASECIEKFYLNLYNNENINRIKLDRFSNEETKAFIQMKMPEYVEYSDIIYKESEGNSLFIIEMINSLKQGMNVSNITDKMATLINSRIINLSSEGRKLVAACSVFYEIFDIKMLSQVTGFDSFKLVEPIEELISKNILKEIKHSGNKDGLIFTHQKIREYVYGTVSNSKRTVLHEIAGEYYETKLRNSKIDRIYYANLIYHFTMADNKYKVFKYEVKNMQVIFDVSHEIFPVLEDKKYTGFFELYTDESQLDEKFKKLKEIYEELNFDVNNEMYELQIIYLHLYGRFHKDIGYASKGLDALEKMIDLSLKRGYLDYSFEGYLQLIQYAINAHNLELMKDSIENAQRIANTINDMGKSGIALRFKGYLCILECNYKTGKEYILQAIDLFNSLNDSVKYILNVAASYFYIGESYRLQKKYIEAIEYYDRAYELCDEDEDFPAIALIFSKIGFSKFQLEIYDEAQFYFLKSLKAYNKTVFAWGRAEVYYYLALIYDKKKMKEKSRSYLSGAILFSDKYYNNDLKKKAQAYFYNIEK